VIDFVNPNILYAGLFPTGGSCASFHRLLVKSIDGGTSWSSISTDPPPGPSVEPPGHGCDIINALLMDPTDASTLYVANNQFHEFLYPLVKSTDGGATWSALFGVAAPIAALAIEPRNPNTLYAGTFKYPYPLPSASGVFKAAMAARSGVTLA